MKGKARAVLGIAILGACTASGLGAQKKVEVVNLRPNEEFRRARQLRLSLVELRIARRLPETDPE